MRKIQMIVVITWLAGFAVGLREAPASEPPGDSDPVWFGYYGDRIVIPGQFPSAVRVRIGDAPAEVSAWQDDQIVANIPEIDPGEYLLTVLDEKGFEWARGAILVLSGSVDDSADPPQRPVITGAWVSGNAENPKLEIAGLYFARGNPEEIEVYANGVLLPVDAATTYHLSAALIGELPAEGAPLNIEVRNLLNGTARSTTILYSRSEGDEDNPPAGAATCGALRLTPTRGLRGSKVSLTLSGAPADFEPDLRFEYEGASRRVTHCNRVGDRWDYNVADLGLTGPTRIQVRVANCPPGPTNPLPFDYMVPPEAQGSPPIAPVSGPSGTPVEISVKNLVQFQTSLLLSEVLMSSADHGLWTARFRSSQICRDNPNCPVNVQTVDEGAGLYKVRFQIPRDVHPGRVNISLYYTYVPCGTEVRTSVSLSLVSFMVTPPDNFTMQITDPPDRPPRRIAAHGRSADYTVTLRNGTGRALAVNLGALAVSAHGATCRFLDGDRSFSCAAPAIISVPPGEKSVTLRWDTATASRTQITVEFYVRAYADDIGALLYPPTNLPEGDPGRLPARLIIQPEAGPRVQLQMTDPGPPTYTRMTCQGAEANFTLSLSNVGEVDQNNVRLDVAYLSTYRPTECRFIVGDRQGDRAVNCFIDNVAIAAGDNPKTVTLRFYTENMQPGTLMPFQVRALGVGGPSVAPPPPQQAGINAPYSCQPGFIIDPPAHYRTIGPGETARFDYTVQGQGGFRGAVDLSISKVERCLDEGACIQREMVRASEWQGSLALSPGRVILPPNSAVTLTAGAPFTQRTGRYIITWTARGAGPTRDAVASLTINGLQTYYLPHVADGQAGDWKITTKFGLMNLGAATTAQIRLTDDLGNPLAVRIPSQGGEMRSAFGPLSLGPGETLFLETDGSNGTLQTGSAVIATEASLSVFALYSIYDRAGRLVSHASVPTSPLLSRFVFPAWRSAPPEAPRNTGVAFYNPTAQTVSLRVSLYEAGGGMPVKTAQLELRPRQHLAKFINESPLFPNLAPNFKGMIAVESTSPVSAVALLIDGLLQATVPRVAVLPVEAHTTLFLPQVADGVGLNGSLRMKTTFILNNPQALEAQVTIRLTRENGEPFEVTIDGRRQSTITKTIPANGSVFLETDGSMPLASGAAVVTSPNVTINAALVYTLYDALTGEPLSMVGVLDSPPKSRLTIPVDKTGEASVGLALFNPNGGPVNLTLRLINRNGTLQLTRTLPLRTRDHVVGFLGEAPFDFTVDRNFQGSLAITSDDPQGISAVGLLFRNGQMASVQLTEGAIPGP